VNNAIYECWKYDIGCHAYFSCGAARGSEIKRLPDFNKCQFLWNSIRFQLRSHKNQAHGRTFNEQVDHWLPPSTSRRSIICHLILYPFLHEMGYHLPNANQTNIALSEMFTKTMNLPRVLSTKINRDFMSVLTDYIAPSSLAKTSTTDQMASHFHHSREIHNAFYSAETFQRDVHGNMIPGPLSVAHQIWNALGENHSHCSNTMRPISNRVIMTKQQYDYAAKRAYGRQSARVTQLQYDAIHFASSEEINKHSFVLMACGTGKSGIYNLLLLGAYLNMAPIPRCVVISPHNSLLSMHVLQAKHYLRGTNLKIISLLPSDIQNQDMTSYFDLLFISIHAFNDLMISQRDLLLQWNIQNIFVDEYHNVVGELFRFSTSWQSLRLCSSLNSKIMLLSGTSDRILMKYISTFMGIGEYGIIGSVSSYSVPNVCITIVRNERFIEREHLLHAVVKHCRMLIDKKTESTFKIHVITMSRIDASELSDKLNAAGMPSMWLTSNMPPKQKFHMLQLWEDGEQKVLVSTFTDGIDNSATENVVIVGGTYSVCSLVQAIGRIRPNRQNITKASLTIYHSSKYVEYDEQSLDDNISRAIGAGIFPQQGRATAKAYYKKNFHIIGYKNWTESTSCYRKSLFDLFSIQSQSCLHCTNCISENKVNLSSQQAISMITREEAQRQKVLGALKQMTNICLICSRSACNGIQCFPSKPSRCFCCHVAIVKRTFHDSAKCPANTSSKNIDTKGQACPSCFLSFSKDIQERGTSEDHKNNSCLHQKRIKRVLLYGVENAQDPGISARSLLVSVLSNPVHWFEVMSRNIDYINKRKSFN
jgi:superfamily II DNA helicase RecQ